MQDTQVPMRPRPTLLLGFDLPAPRTDQLSSNQSTDSTPSPITVQSDKSQLKWGLTNLRSIMNKSYELEAFVSTYTPDIFCVCETWLTADTPSGLCCPTGYTIIRKDRPTRGGGVAIFLSNKLKYNIINIDENFAGIEIVCVDVFVGSDCSRVIAYYRPPGMGASDITYAINSTVLLRKLCSTNKQIFLMGDFNLPDIDWSFYHGPDNIIYNHFIDFINCHGLTQLCNKPTRNENILDLILTSVDAKISDLTYLPPIGSSDHNVILFDSLISSTTPIEDVPLIQYDWLRADYASIQRELVSVNWNQIFQYSITVEECWKSFCHITTNIINKFVPTFCPKAAKQNHKKRYPQYIKTLIKDKAVAWKRWKITKTDRDKAAYSDSANKCTIAITNYNYAQELNLLRKNNLGSFYRFVNNKLSSKSTITSIRLPNGTLTDDPVIKSKIFNDFFSSVFTTDDGIAPPLDSRVPPGVEISSIEFTPLSVYNSLKQLKSSTSSGPDGLPNILLKNCAEAFSVPLSHIFDISFKDGVLPQCWKSAHVIPVYKKGCAADPNNYRPISLTSTCCKVMERVLNREIVKYLLAHNLITTQQHGFIHKRSACTNLLESVYDWSVNLELRKKSDVIYFDFKKAFDSVTHDKLITKMQAYGFTGNLLHWLQQFLSDRSQIVKIDSSYSSPCRVSSGVIQGSVLGPTLFLLFINDIADLFSDLDVTCKLFADDLKLYSKCDQNGSDDLPVAIDRLCNWCTTWQLSIAINKCSVCSIRNANLYNNINYNYSLSGNIILTCDTVRDLGIEIDSSLKFDKHISLIVHKAMTRCKLILKSFLSKDPTLLLRAFNTYVRPILEYCSPVWSPHYKYLVNKLEHVQQYFTKRLPGLWHNSYKERLNRLGIHTLECRRVITDMQFCYHILNKNIDSTIYNCFILKNNVNTGTKTRGNDFKLLKHFASNNHVKYFFSNRVIDHWNQLPNEIVSTTSINTFKSRLNKCFCRCNFN